MAKVGNCSAAVVVPPRIGPVALVAGVEQAAQVLVVLGLLLGAEDGVRLVHQQGGRVVGDGPDHGRRVR